MASGWIEKVGATGETMKAWLDANIPAAMVHTSTRTGATIAYSANGLMLRQTETVEVTEYRGLEEDAAELLLDLIADNTVRTNYYHEITDASGNYLSAAVVSVLTGSKTDVAATRRGAAGEWVAVVTVLTYGVAGSNLRTGAQGVVTEGWTTTRPTAAATDGVVTDYSETERRAYTLIQNGLPHSMYIITKTTTREYQFLTQAEAMAKVIALVTIASDYYTKRWYYSQSLENNGTRLWYVYLENLKVEAFARFVDAERGWTVTEITTEEVGRTNGNWTLETGEWYVKYKWYESASSNEPGSLDDGSTTDLDAEEEA